MNASQAWKKLGLDKTQDKRAIKRAYAAKLKAIDPDSDPKGFLALREALDMALWQADIAEQPHNDDAFDEDEDEHYDAYGENWSGDHAEEYVPPPLDEDGIRRHRLAEILWDDDPIWPMEAEAQQLIEQIVAEAEAGNIEEAGQTEDWLLWLTANTIRRSDCIIPYLEGHYRWREKVGTIHASHAHNAVGGRYDDLVVLAALKRPDHPDHPAFEQLTLPREFPPDYFQRAALGANIRNLIGNIRQNNPTVEWDFDANTVALWEQAVGRIVPLPPEEKPAKFSWYFWLFLIVFIANILSMLAR